MTDRKPGAPGQYAAVITAAELAKLQNGEQFTITLTRDDQPITEGTPYSKAAVLPDALAAVICPAVTDPTPADALAGLLPRNGKRSMTGNLPMDGNKITGLGTPTENADAANKAYADLAARKASPRNLLDNSDFTNPVNQRGFVSGSVVEPYEYFLDRWVNNENAQYPTLGAEGIGSISNGISQRLDLTSHIGEKVTIAVYSDRGTVSCYASGTVTSNEQWSVIAASPNWECSVVSITSNLWQCIVSVPCKYVALYLGEYTEETLPEYQPKGYGAELLECQRYYYRLKAWTVLGFGLVDWDGTTVKVFAPAGIAMHHNPTVFASELYFRAAGITGETLSGITPVATVSGNGVFLEYKNVPNITAYTCGNVAIGGSDFVFSAEL